MSEDKRWQNRVELSLDNRQIFLLFFASAAVLALVFALGVVVGKRSDTVPGKAAPTDALALLDQMGADSGEETLTFHEALTKTEPPKTDPAASSAATPAAPAPSASTPDPKPAAAPAPAAPSKPQRSPEPADNRQRAAPAPKSIVKALAAAIPGAQAPSDESDTSSGKKPTHKPTKEPLAAKAAKGKKPEAKDASEGLPSPEGEGTYTLQLSAFQEKREAEAFMQKLRESGMQPFMTSTTIPGRGVWFRVRLGKYRTWEEALAAKQDFEKKAKLIAYVSKN